MKAYPRRSFSCTKDWTNCRGFLIDTDLTVKVNPDDVTLLQDSQADKEISVCMFSLPKAEVMFLIGTQGTLPFMSYRIVKALKVGKPVAHTVWDDLESFVWVLVWEYLYKAKERGCLTGGELEILQDLASDEYRSVILAKVVIRVGEVEKPFGSSFWPLITKWFACTRSREIESWDSVYDEFLSAGVGCLNDSTDWDSWDNFFGPRKQPHTSDAK